MVLQLSQVARNSILRNECEMVNAAARALEYTMRAVVRPSQKSESPNKNYT